MVKDNYFQILTVYHSKESDVFMLKLANWAKILVKLWVKIVTFDSLDQFFFEFLRKRHLKFMETPAKTSSHEIFFSISYKLLRP